MSLKPMLYFWANSCSCPTGFLYLQPQRVTCSPQDSFRGLPIMPDTFNSSNVLRESWDIVPLESHHRERGGDRTGIILLHLTEKETETREKKGLAWSHITKTQAAWLTEPPFCYAPRSPLPCPHLGTGVGLFTRKQNYSWGSKVQLWCYSSGKWWPVEAKQTWGHLVGCRGWREG